jgi:fructosamine-3-kinase
MESASMNTFKKLNPMPGSESLACEADGLKELAKPPHELNIPKVLELNKDYIILEFIASTSPTKKDWKELAQGLAKIHNCLADSFGYQYDNYIGLNVQKNSWNHNWGEFFVHERLKFQVNQIKDPSLRGEFLKTLVEKAAELTQFLNEHKPRPSLVHGDLWNGNVMFSQKGPWLIDPAVYYADPEVDLAMTEMFGGFDTEFYSEYFKHNPKKPGYEKRKIIYNLYHYLNHYNLFGESYLQAVMRGFEFLN